MFRYFGSKHGLAATYQAPRYPLIVEPFGGAAGYSCYWLRRNSQTTAAVYDSNPAVIAMWDRLLTVDVTSIPRPTKGHVTSDPFYLGSYGSTGSWIRFTKRGDYQITDRMVEHFDRHAALVAYDQTRFAGRLTVQEADYRSIPNWVGTWFIDPPYQHQGHQYAHNALDYDWLAGWIEERSGEAIVTEAEPADWLPFAPHRIQADINGQPKTELVWYSDPEPTLLDWNAE